MKSGKIALDNILKLSRFNNNSILIRQRNYEVSHVIAGPRTEQKFDYWAFKSYAIIYATYKPMFPVAK